MIRFRIADLVGIKNIDLELAGVVLVAGANGAGKTSLLQAANAALTRQWPMRGVSKKGDTIGLVRKGATVGTTTAVWEKGAARVSYTLGDGATIDTKGRQHDPEPTALALGSSPFMALPTETRVKLVTDEWNAVPTKDDLAQWCRENPAAGVNPAAAQPREAGEVHPTAFSLLWEDIDLQGWDALARRYTQEATRLTGAWKEVTGKGWGTQVRLTWVPDRLFADEEYSEADAQTAHKEAYDAMVRLQTAQGVGAAEISRLEAVAGTLSAIDADIATQAELADTNALAAETVLRKIEDFPRPVDPALDILCPHCEQPILPKRSGATFIVEKVGKRMTKKEYQQKSVEHEALVAEATLANQQVESDQHAAVTLAERRRVAEQAARDLVAARDRQDSDPLELEEAVAAEKEAAAFLDAVRRLHRARHLNAQWESTNAIADMLGPKGLRAAVFNRKLSEINTTLSATSEQAGMREVSMGPDADLRYDGRAYVLISESERWRCDFVMARTIGERQGLNIQLVDRFDVLDPGSRGKVIEMLHARKVDALVCMTAKNLAAVPDLAKVKMGRTVWLENGEIK